VKLPSRLRLSIADRRTLSAVAGGTEPADLALTGGLVLNVFTGRTTPASVGISGGRIAWVGDPPAPALREHDLEGGTVVPGLIDPHCHADLLCTPSAFAQAAARAGTTTAVVDTHTPSFWLADEPLAAAMDVLEDLPMKFLWGVRPARDSGGLADDAALPPARLERLLARPGVAGAGELTAWRALLDGDARLEGFVTAVTDAGLNVDAHAPGASPATLARLVAAGITSDHEAINGDELAARVELGLWTIVRHSSLRADGVELGRAIAERQLPTARLLLTADGLIPQDLARGHLDTVVRKVVEGGVAPVDAIRMATVNAATYLGLDAHLGSVAPGRCADLVVVDGLDAFAPRQVMTDGRLLDRDAAPDGRIDWGAMRIAMAAAPVTAATIRAVCEPAPPIRMGAVVARLADAPAAAAEGPPTYVAMVARDGKTIVGTTTRDFDVRAVASSVTAMMDVLLMGTDPEAMAAAYAHVVRSAGGLSCPAGDVPLPTLGSMTDLPIDELAHALEQFERDAGLPAGGPPFSYRTLFLTLPALPGVCLTMDGLLDVKSGRLLTEPMSL
jgi:adenine deaminase